jgi:hypothetical protein
MEAANAGKVKIDIATPINGATLKKMHETLLLSTLKILLKVPKRVIFDRSDF